MRTIQIHPLSLAVGAIAVSAAFVLTAQTTPPAQTTWPPPKSMIVNVFEELAPPVSVPPGGAHTVLTVPSERWLTITGASLAAGGPYKWLEQTASGQQTFKGYGGFSNSPLVSPSDCGGPVGWTLAPGSTLSIVNYSANPENLSGYSLIGYYSRN